MKKNLALCLCFVFMGSGLLACSDDKDDDKQPCKAADYPQCEGSKLLRCVDGFIQSQTCTAGCDEAAKVCKFTVIECSNVDYPKCDGANLLTCVEGKVASQTCSAGCDAAAKVCKFEEIKCVAADYPKCDGANLLSCVAGNVESQTCSAGCDAAAKVCKLEEIKCVAADYPKCDGANLLSCVAGNVESQTCSAGCDAAAKVCKLEEIKCVAADYPKCDGTKIETCSDGKVISTSCDAGQVCKDEGEVKCVNATQTCDAGTHVISCNGNMRVLCESNVIVERACKVKEICSDGACKVDESSPLDEACEFGVFVEKCYMDDMPLVCPPKYKKIAIHADYPKGCKAKGLVCGTTTTDEITEVDCFEPCSVLDSNREHCGDSAGTIYEWIDKCIAIGKDSKNKPVYGYEQIQGTFNACDLGCDGTKCKTSSEIGKACEDDSYKSKCDGNVSIYCSDALVEGSTCGELTCVAGLNSSDACLEPCTTGDLPKRKCIPFLGKQATIDYTCETVGSPSANYYVKGMAIISCDGSCLDGVCK